MVVEGDVIYDVDDAYAKFFYRNTWNKDPSNWWIPTIPCLREWIESSYFEILKEYPEKPRSSQKFSVGLANVFKAHTEPKVGRYVITARAVKRNDTKYFYPDPELGRFDTRA